MWNLDYFLDYSLDNLLNLDYLTNYLFNCYNLFLDNFYFLDFGDSVINNPFNNYWFLNFDNLFNNDFYVHYFGDLNNPLYNFLDNSWYFYNFFSESLNFNNFLYHIVNILDDLNRNMYNSLHLLNLHNFDDLLNDLLDRDHLRDLDYTFYDFLDNLFDLDDFRNHSEHFEDICYVNNAHDLLVDHANYTLIDLENCTCFTFQLFNFLEQCFDQHPQMELHFLWFVAAVCVHILYFDLLWHIFDNFHNTIQFIDFNDINQFLLEELEESLITFIT